MKEKIKRSGEVLSFLLVIGVFTVLWFFLYSITMPVVEVSLSQPGIVDLRTMDLSSQVARLPGTWEFYPEKLYTTEDFKEGNAIEPVLRSEIEGADQIPYGTHRLVIEAPANQYFAICGYSIDYGTNVFVNGISSTEIGHVSDNPDEAIPCVNYINVPVFTGEDGIVELIFQYSNYAHNEGGGQTSLLFSTPENIERYQINENLPVYLLSGGFLLLAFYNVLDGVLRRRREAFHLACCCFLFALRDQAFYIVQLIPWNYNWVFHYRVVVLVVTLIPMSEMLLIESLYPKLVNKWITIGATVGTLVCAGLMFFVPTKQVVNISDWATKFGEIYMVWLGICIGRYFYKKRSINFKDGLTLFGIFVMFLAVIIEKFYNRIIPDITRGGVTPASLAVFVIILMSVVALQAREDRHTLIEAQEKEKMLKQLDRAKSDFLQKVAHELKTPLTVISGYAQVSGWQIGKEDKQEEVQGYMKIISSEAQRLGRMVEQLVDISNGAYKKSVKCKVSLLELLKQLVQICEPIVAKNHNTIVVTCDQECFIYGNQEMMLQVLLNLVVNANKHTKMGEIELEIKLEEQTNQVFISVSDTGSGIAIEHRGHVFEKGYSPDGGNGLGLSICREILEFHNGTIEIKHSDDNGTTMMLTIPRYQFGGYDHD